MNPKKVGVFRPERAVDHADGVGQAQRGEGLAQRSAWQHAAVSEAGDTVDRQNLDVSGQAVMLEAVIEHQNFGAEGRHRAQTHDGAVAAHQHGDAGRVRREEQRLVSRLAASAANEFTIGDEQDTLATSSPVAATRECDPMPAAAQLTCDPCRGRRLARTADDEVSDAHDLAAEPPTRTQPALIRHAVKSGAGRVDPRDRIER
jgi:hypothetical protein